MEISFQFPMYQLLQIHAIHLRVDQMRNVIMEYVHAYPTTVEIHTNRADLNVLEVKNALEIKDALEINVVTHVQAFVGKTRNAMLSITSLVVPV